jgi:hypothetical protein
VFPRLGSIAETNISANSSLKTTSEHLSPIVYFLVSFEIVEPRECFSAFRTLMRPFPSVTKLVVLAMKVA